MKQPWGQGDKKNYFYLPISQCPIPRNKIPLAVFFLAARGITYVVVYKWFSIVAYVIDFKAYIWFCVVT
jgi:hypothetical protein